MFFASNKDENKKYISNENLQSRRKSGHLVHQFGAIYKNAMEPFWRNVYTVKQYPLPHRFFNSISDTHFTHQLFTLLQDDEFITLAKNMETILRARRTRTEQTNTRNTTLQIEEVQRPQ